MKLKINTELEMSEDKNNVCERFGITKEEVANHIDFYFKHETLTGYSDIIIELVKDNRLDIVCTLATAYLKIADKSVQPPEYIISNGCHLCDGTGIIDDKYCPSCVGTGKANEIECPDCDGIGYYEKTASGIPYEKIDCETCKGTGKI